MLYHTVLYQFAADTPKETIDDAMESMREMKAIPCVRSIVVGVNLMPVTDGWTHGMTIVFDSFASMMGEFANHPLHLKVVQNQVPLFSRYMAMDVEPDAV